MEVTTTIKFLRIITWAAPTAVILWSVFTAIRQKTDHKQQETRNGFLFSLLWAGALSLVLLIATSINVKSANSDTVLWVNGLAGLVLCVFACILGRILAQPVNKNEASYEFLPVAGLALAVMLGSYLVMKHSARPDAWLLAPALGASLFAFAFCLTASHASKQCGRTICPSLGLAASATAVAGLALLIGKLAYPDYTRAGDAFIYILGIGIFVWLVLAVAQKLFSGSSAVAGLLFAVYLAVSALLVFQIVKITSIEARTAPAIIAGLITGGIAALATSVSLSERHRTQAKAAFFMLVFAATSFAIGRQAGFGVVAAATGILLGIPAWALLSPLRIHNTELKAIPDVFIWAPGFLALFAAVRVWLTWQEGIRINIHTPYPFMGLVIGLALPYLIYLMTAGDDSGEAKSIVDAALAPIFGCLLLVLAVILTCAIFREPSVRLMLFGLAAAGLSGSLVLASVKKVWAEPIVSGSLLAGLTTLIHGDHLMRFSAEVTRSSKMALVGIAFVLFAAAYLITELAAALQGKTAGKTQE